MKRVYIIAAFVIVFIILYLIFTYTKLSSETYDTTINLIVVDGNGNMSAVAIRPPSLSGIQSTSNIVYVDSTGNIGSMSVGDVYTSYQGNSSNNIRNLLTIDANNNFSVISTLEFNPCSVNGNPLRNPNATMNGTPQTDGTCKCLKNTKWSGDKCDFCDREYKSLTDRSVGPQCEYSRLYSCNNHGNIDINTGRCVCDPTYAGPACQMSDAEYCNGKGTVGEDGSCTSCIGNWDPRWRCALCKAGWTESGWDSNLNQYTLCVKK